MAIGVGVGGTGVEVAAGKGVEVAVGTGVGEGGTVGLVVGVLEGRGKDVGVDVGGVAPGAGLLSEVGLAMVTVAVGVAVGPGVAVGNGVGVGGRVGSGTGVSVASSTTITTGVRLAISATVTSVGDGVSGAGRSAANRTPVLVTTDQPLAKTSQATANTNTDATRMGRCGRQGLTLRPQCGQSVSSVETRRWQWLQRMAPP